MPSSRSQADARRAVSESKPVAPKSEGRALSVAGLFAGIGGIERGLQRAGHRSELLCEFDVGARAVLAARFPETRLTEDVRTLRSLPAVDLVAAGFPCQDLSQAGRTRGIAGAQSSLVDHLFRLVAGRRRPRRLLIENVPFMLQLERGRAMTHLTTRLESLGYRWAYRIVDARAFGIPQRRRRVLLLADREEDPAGVLAVDDHPGIPERAETAESTEASAYGFYWTEGTRGVGWGIDAVPTLKGGSGLGIPSPPAIWLPETGEFGTPDLRDAERLQGFPVDWTAPSTAATGRPNGRWKLIGNAVFVPWFEWLGKRLAAPKGHRTLPIGEPFATSWPAAACGGEGKRFRLDVSERPAARRERGLAEFLRFPLQPLSHRAAAGFLGRARRSSLRFRADFLEALDAHVRRTAPNRTARQRPKTKRTSP